MGWLYPTGISRKDLIASRVEPFESVVDGLQVTTTCIKHCFRGGVFSGVLWSVWQRTFTKDGVEQQPEQRWICCDLIRCHAGEWGYKDMDESVHPYYYSCPLGYLDQVPIETFGGCQDWRAIVQAHHAERKAKRLAKKATATPQS